MTLGPTRSVEVHPLTCVVISGQFVLSTLQRKPGPAIEQTLSFCQVPFTGATPQSFSVVPEPSVVVQVQFPANVPDAWLWRYTHTLPEHQVAGAPFEANP